MVLSGLLIPTLRGRGRGTSPMQDKDKHLDNTQHEGKGDHGVERDRVEWDEVGTRE